MSKLPCIRATVPAEIHRCRDYPNRCSDSCPYIAYDWYDCDVYCELFSKELKPSHYSVCPTRVGADNPPKACKECLNHFRLDSCEDRTPSPWNTDW